MGRSQGCFETSDYVQESPHSKDLSDLKCQEHPDRLEHPAPDKEELVLWMDYKFSGLQRICSVALLHAKTGRLEPRLSFTPVYSHHMAQSQVNSRPSVNFG